MKQLFKISIYAELDRKYYVLAKTEKQALEYAENYLKPNQYDVEFDYSVRNILKISIEERKYFIDDNATIDDAELCQTINERVGEVFAKILLEQQKKEFQDKNQIKIF